jgi:putative tricarboxylic transport membrane protein
MGARNILAAIVLIVLGIVYGALAARLPTRQIDQTTEPSFFPFVVVACVLALSIALLIQGIRARANEAATGATPPARGAKGRAVAALGLAVAYLALLPSLGFLAANIPFFAGLMILFGERRPIWIVVGALGVPVVLFYLFRDVFQILLPAGVLVGLV